MKSYDLIDLNDSVVLLIVELNKMQLTEDKLTLLIDNIVAINELGADYMSINGNNVVFYNSEKDYMDTYESDTNTLVEGGTIV